MTTSLSTRAQEFRDQLAHRVIVADGAMGTMLYSRGVFINRCFDELNVAQPDLVRQIHREYVKAGAEILETNTFGANRARLSAFGIAEKLVAINQAGVRIAREAAGDSDVYIAGAMGPLGVRIEPLGPTSFTDSPRDLPRTGRSLDRRRRRPADPGNLRQSRRAPRGRAGGT